MAQRNLQDGRILVVGAGLAGAVYARTLAEAGYRVHVIDQRDHIGGNVYDRVDENGVRVHVYGPHLFHTKIQRTATWFRRFGTFVPYTHKVRARLADGSNVPLPINLETINTVFGVALSDGTEAKTFLASIALRIDDPTNAAEYLKSRIGENLTDLFFRPYTKKMWSFDLEDMSATVVKRIPLHYDRSDTYFDTNEMQMLPEDGYTKVFENIFDHPGITVQLKTKFRKEQLREFTHCFNAMPIDEYYEFCFGELPYRSIRFHHRTEALNGVPAWSVTNFTDDGLFTRETTWHALPNHLCKNTGRITITKEEPCDYRDNHLERYYPVKTSDGRYGKIYQKYKDLSDTDASSITFIGRCGTYQYLDMDQVINQSLTRVEAWIEKGKGVEVAA
ncbi:UDP-galactopyranose mutase [Methylorubrum extorquens]